MKKFAIILCAGVAVTACSNFEPDLDMARDIRDENNRLAREEVGCTFAGDHDAYRQCVLNTYYKNTPKTFVTGRTEDGKALAILKNESTSSYDESTGTYKTERVIVIETEERLVDIPTPSPITATANLVETVPPLPAETKDPVVPAQVETVPPLPAETKEPVVPAQNPVQNADEIVSDIVVNSETITETVPPPEPILEKEETWWSQYKKQPAQPAPVCPCLDPNEPCPQCVDK